jgi:hypothetical protein
MHELIIILETPSLSVTSISTIIWSLHLSEEVVVPMGSSKEETGGELSPQMTMQENIETRCIIKTSNIIIVMIRA